MVNPQVPGIYVDEQKYILNPLRIDNRCLTGFVGIAEKGPLHKPIHIKSFDEYLKTFGSFDTAGYLPYSVYNYFKCGGAECVIVRVANEKHAKKARLEVKCTGGGKVVFEALSEGAWGNYISARIWHEKENYVSMTLSCKNVNENFLHLSMDPSSERYFLTYINERSRLCNVSADSIKGIMKPEFSVYASEGKDGIAEMTAGDFIGNYNGPNQYRGLGALESIDDISLISVSDISWLYSQAGTNEDEREKAMFAIHAAMISQAERFPGRFAILDVPAHLDSVEILNWAKKFDSSFAASYFPFIDMLDPLDQTGTRTVRVPPSGAICGSISAVDSQDGIFHAPANVLLHGAVGLASRIEDSEYEMLYPAGINLLKYFPGKGIKIWGARTMSSNPDWRFINVRRTFSSICRSLKIGTQWAVFETNDKKLWKRIVRQVSGFLLDLWMKGYLAGSTSEQGFFVRCDEELNPPENIDKGIVTFSVGLAITKPTEFYKIAITAEKDGASVYINED
jgi:hypothetical protein